MRMRSTWRPAGEVTCVQVGTAAVAFTERYSVPELCPTHTASELLGATATKLM